MAEVPLAQALATATAAAQTAAAALEEARRGQTAGLATKPKELELSGRPGRPKVVGRLEVCRNAVFGFQGWSLPARGRSGHRSQRPNRNGHSDGCETAAHKIVVHVPVWEREGQAISHAEGARVGFISQWL